MSYGICIRTEYMLYMKVSIFFRKCPASVAALKTETCIRNIICESEVVCVVLLATLD